jgi:hypothetical protein
MRHACNASRNTGGVYVKFSMEVKGLEQLTEQLRTIPKEMQQEAADELYRQAEDVMADSKESYVPVDTGRLRSTGHVQPPRRDGNTTVVRFGYRDPRDNV